MKLLPITFFALLALTYGAPIDTSDNEITKRDLDDFLTGLAFASEEDVRVEDFQSKLRDRLEEILEQIKDAIDDGKHVKEDLLTKVKELREKLKSEVGEKAKELLKKIKENGRDYLKKVLNKLGLSKRDIEERADAILEGEQTSLEEVQKQLKERLDEVLKKIKDAIDQGKAVREDMIAKMKELKKKMKDMNLDLDNKSKEILERIKNKGRDILKQILEKLGFDRAEERAQDILLMAEHDTNKLEKLKEEFNKLVKHLKDSLEGNQSISDLLKKFREFQYYLKNVKVELSDDSKDFIEKIRNKFENYWKSLKEKFGKKRSADIDIFGMIDQIKELVKDKFNPDKLKQIVEKYLGKGNEAAQRLIDALKERGEKRKQKILEWIDRVFENKNSIKRSIKDAYEKVKNYFRVLGIEMKEKYFRFGEWVKIHYDNGLEKVKDRDGNVRKIARLFLDDPTFVDKGVAREALNFFREYDEVLGNVFDDIKEKIKNITDSK